MDKLILDLQKDIINEKKNLYDKTKGIIGELKNDILNMIDLSQKNENDNVNNFDLELKDSNSISNKVNTNNSLDNNSKIISIRKNLEKIEKANFIKNFNDNTNTFYNSLSKFGKDFTLIEKENDYDQEIPKMYDTDKKIFIEILCHDLLRRGDFNTVDTLVLESNVNINSDICNIFKEYALIIKELKNNSLNSITNWVKLNYKKLEDIESDLEFKIMEYKFFSLLLTNNSLSDLNFLKECKIIFEDVINISNEKENINKKFEQINKISEYLSLVFERNVIKDSDENKIVIVNEKLNEKKSFKNFMIQESSKVSKSKNSTLLEKKLNIDYNSILNALIIQFKNNYCTIMSKIYLQKKFLMRVVYLLL